jgi:F0F1-type ATP synthase membrane subunit c/vacuolar-type H+-ATPase subunit K
MKEYFRQLLILYGALAGGQVMFAMVVLVLINQSPIADPGAGRMLYLQITSLLALGAIFSAFSINRTQKRKAPEVEPQDRMPYYRSLVIIRCALIEGLSLFSLVIAMTTNDMLFFLYFAGAMIVFMMFRPGIEEYLQMFQVTAQEAAKIRQEVAN